VDPRRTVSGMGKPLRRRLGMHAYVKEHPSEGRVRDLVGDSVSGRSTRSVDSAESATVPDFFLPGTRRTKGASVEHGDDGRAGSMTRPCCLSTTAGELSPPPDLVGHDAGAKGGLPAFA
jgi:hypothetical protein